MSTRWQTKRDTAANWTTNDPVLLNGEIGYETDTGQFKIGDGATVWSSLSYSGVSGGDHATLTNLDFASAGHTGFEPTVTKGDLTAGSTKITIGGTGTGAVIGSGASVDVVENQVDHNSLNNTHNLTTDIDHDSLTNAHNLTTDIDHDSITNTHNLTTDIDHDQLTNFVADEHIDWTQDQGATDIHSGNIPDLSSTYQLLDAGLTDISGLSVDDGNIIVGDGMNWVAESGATARTSLGLGAGDSPAFTGLDLTGIADGYVPYISVSGLAASPLYYDGSYLGMGTSSPITALSLFGTSAVSSAISEERRSDDAFGPYLYLTKSRGDVVNCQDGDQCGSLLVRFWTGSAIENVAAVVGSVTDVSSGAECGSLEFFIRQAGAIMLAGMPRMKIDATGATLQGKYLGPTLYDLTFDTQLTIVDEDAGISIVSEDAGVWGSAIDLKQIDGASYENMWSIARQTNGDGTGDGSLRFLYGTSTDFSSLGTTVVTMQTGGNVGFSIPNPQEDVHAADTVRADVAFNLNGTDGVTQAAAAGTVCDVTAIAGGIATAQTQVTYASNGTYTFDATSGNVDSITITNGRITAITTAA